MHIDLYLLVHNFNILNEVLITVLRIGETKNEKRKEKGERMKTFCFKFRVPGASMVISRRSNRSEGSYR